ncbi:MAG: ABC transporter ATP-binding protein [Acidimicrobiia bacterium]
MLRVEGLRVSYNNSVLALDGVDLTVPRGSIIALLGSNGAGKTTLLRAITGLLGVHRGRISAGAITLNGSSLTSARAGQIVRAGVAQVMEGRRLFASLTVEENLKVGGITRSSKSERAATFDAVLDMFPRLAERRAQVAGYLSGGEQQMVAIGRALMASPQLLVLDEPSLGLAPKIVEQIRDLIVDINGRGTSVLLVEQNAAMALSIATYGYVLETGRVVRSDTGMALLADPQIARFYLGIGRD